MQSIKYRINLLLDSFTVDDVLLLKSILVSENFESDITKLNELSIIFHNRTETVLEFICYIMIDMIDYILNPSESKLYTIDLDLKLCCPNNIYLAKL